MATAQARQVYDATGQKAWFGEYTKTWKNNPCIGQNSGFPLKHMTGDRPYILGQIKERVIFNPNHRAVSGEIHYSHNEIKEAQNLIGKLKDYIVIEPHVKKTFSQGNKDWGWHNWLKLVKELRDYPLVQLRKDKDVKGLPGVKTLETNEFRVACAIVKMSRLFVGTDGGLHHAAAAYGIVDNELVYYETPAVVIWGGFSHPQMLGYQCHYNIRANDSPPCGSKVPCQHCKDMMANVPHDLVAKTIKQAYGELSAELD